MAQSAPKSMKVEEKKPGAKNKEEQEGVKPENKNEDQVESDADDETPAKRGRPAKGLKSKTAAGKQSPAKKGGRTSSRLQKTLDKKEESESEQDEEEYEVQTIMDERVWKGRKEYLVKWKGYSKQQATWEPESNLNCDDAIAAYQKKAEKKSYRDNPDSN